MSKHFTPMRLAKRASAYWLQISGPLLTLAVAAVIELLGRTPLAFPNPTAILILIMIWAAFRSGMGAGLISAAISWLYIAYFFSIPTQIFHYTDENFRRVVVWAVVIPLMVLMVGSLHRRALRAVAQAHIQELGLAQLAERQRMLEVEREHASSFRMLFTNNPLPMWVYDIETLHFLEVNDAAIAHYGYTREEFLALRITDIRPSEDLSRLLEDLAAPRPIQQQSGPWRHRRKDGSLITVQIMSHTLTFAERRAVLVVAEDITERKQLEAQVLQMQKMESIGRLAGGIAHDFNNLLTVIIGNISLASESLAPNHPALDDLQAIHAASQRAAGLTHQLLAFARKQILEPRVISLNGLIAEMDKLLRRLIREDIELVTLTASDLWQVKVDPGQIEQVLVNLVVNARDAMLDGGQLTIETRNVVLDDAYVRSHASIIPGSYVMLAVSDTGVGMSPEVQSRLFEPFFTTKEPGKGTGLGLATCYGIIKQSGGNIWVYSEPGHGTTIKVYLPRADESTDFYTVFDEAAPLLGTETVLVVEDEPAVRALATRVLRNLGYAVLEAMNGMEGLDAAQAHAGPIDLLLADVVMPEVGGKALSERLAPQHPNMRVLFMSGYTDNAIVHHGRLDEGVAFLQKPFTPAALARKCVRCWMPHNSEEYMIDQSAPPAYLLKPTQPPIHRFAYIGVPHDPATSIGNPGARFAPDALREALRGVFDWRLRDGKVADIDEGIVDLSPVEVVDWGDVELTYAETDTIVDESCAAVRQALEAGYVPLIVGGDHSISYPCIKAIHDTRSGRIGLIQIDAHNDLMSYSRRQGKYSGSSGMRRALELERLKGANLVQIGLRGYTTVEQYTIGEEYGVHRISAARFAEIGARVAAEQALQWASDDTEAVYLTIDLDVINPGEAPGTGWPEPGGLTTQQVIDIVRFLAPHMTAMDIAELNPLYDTRARATTLIAARLILDFITTRVRQTK